MVIAHYIGPSIAMTLFSSSQFQKSSMKYSDIVGRSAREDDVPDDKNASIVDNVKEYELQEFVCSHKVQGFR